MSDDVTSRLEVVDLGLMPYRQAWAEQQRYHQRCVDTGLGAVLTVQHPSVLTFGKNADEKHLHVAKRFLEERGVEVVHSDRGGEITAHMPGQLVVYPILNLSTRNLGVRGFVSILEQSVIALLARHGIQSAVDERYPGVWVSRERKICALGVRVRQRVTMHGLALNVENDLELFSWIEPCGISGRSVTRMRDLVQTPIKVAEIRDELVTELLMNLAAQG